MNIPKDIIFKAKNVCEFVTNSIYLKESNNEEVFGLELEKRQYAREFIKYIEINEDLQELKSKVKPKEQILVDNIMDLKFANLLSESEVEELGRRVMFKSNNGDI